MPTALSTKRLMRELGQMSKSSHGSHVRLVNCEKMDLWSVAILGAEGTLYAGEEFRLQFRFPADYPLESPEVVFVGKRVPVHPHVYSNGHICLSILYQQWSPALTVEAVCLSILSMLSSCTHKMVLGQRKLSAQLRKSTVPTFYIVAALLLAAAFIIAESYILYLTKDGYDVAKRELWQIADVQKAVSTSITTYMVYNVLFITAQAYIVFLCAEALANQDAIQVIVVVLFYFICTVYTTTRYISFYVWPSLAARLFTRDSNMHLMQITVVAAYAVALVALVVLSYRLKKDAGWGVFKRLGADVVLHRAYKWHQCLAILLKMDIYFIGSYLVQMSALVLKADDTETWLQITVFIPFSIMVIFCAFYALHGERRRLMACVAACFFLSIGYFVFKIVRVCSPDIMHKPGDPYEDSRPYFMITIVVCLVLVLASGAVSVVCIRNFDCGLKEAIFYDKLKRRHLRMYLAEPAAAHAESVDDEVPLLVLNSHRASQATARGRFPLE
ncbi:hypothetical protein IW140_003923 [Coemansia sp. RSA 1813]|nr:hypothetical protein EV178_003734 [Coemansia sp. RSA 1646]KAJ1771878.1 hypothetical protein LPJ74_001912 [Coemansia sp. RSA 1843]KAJ2088600.1 hypothetical protein IW138_004090 [Coemansia sp. RSA 986]KAJ2212218.1 hypothetical protein EV179_004845 [Coemansia sp. RSA 487]KAJ2568380.1 hypothetical protein IW140_003923 [Coemansia sp. RSA 1813]